MGSRVVLVSDELDFFEFVQQKLNLRHSDELFKYSFDDIPSILYLLDSALLIINSENRKEQSLQLLGMLNNSLAICFLLNDDEEFKVSAYKKGMFSCFTPYETDDMFQSIIFSALKISSLYKKNVQYRDILVKKKLLCNVNEVWTDYNYILDLEFDKIHENSLNAILVAIAPDEKSKFMVMSNQIETNIINNIRVNDIVLTYAPNKYFLLLYDLNFSQAEIIVNNIKNSISEPIYAGFARVLSKSRQEVVNEVLSHLHQDINSSKSYNASTESQGNSDIVNFKQFKEDYNKKILNIINPAFYHIKQKYIDKIFGVCINTDISDKDSVLSLKNKFIESAFKVSTAGFSKINIDISYTNDKKSKRFSFDIKQFDETLLEDLLEQFVSEFKKEAFNDNT